MTLLLSAPLHLSFCLFLHLLLSSLSHSVLQKSPSSTTVDGRYMSRRSKPKTRLQQLREQIVKMGGEDTPQRFETLQLHAGKLLKGALVAAIFDLSTSHDNMILTRYFCQATSPTRRPTLALSQFTPRLPTSSMTRPTVPGYLA